jgi:hypothetical protein
MDVLYFLGDRLDFIRSLYADSTAPFIKIKRKIESNEDPYIYAFDPDYDSGEPPFLDEWQHADDCIVSLGRWSVLLLSSALKGYLETFSKDLVMNYGHIFPDLQDYEKKLSIHKKSKGWLRGNQRLFLETYRIDWNQGPRLIDSLEHLVLTRNDLEHNTDLISQFIYQSPYHKKKQSEGIFTDTEKYFWEDEYALMVDQYRLDLAIKGVGEFCEWLDRIRADYIRFRKPDTYEQFLSESPPHTQDEDQE